MKVVVKENETTAQAYERTEREIREARDKQPIYLQPPVKSFAPRVVGLNYTPTFGLRK